MNSADLDERGLEAAGLRGSQRLPAVIFGALVLAGAWAFVTGISGPRALRCWQAYLVNFVFWTGTVFGSVLFVAVINMTNAHWARPLKRFAEAPGAFIPVLFLLFWPIYGGREILFSWIHAPAEGKEGWLSVPFLFARDGVSLLLLGAVSLALIFFSVRGDMKLHARKPWKKKEGDPRFPSPAPSLSGAASRGWRMQLVLSPLVGISYAVVLSLLAFDLIMSLDPEWISTLFGAYYFIGGFYTALAAIAALSYLAMNFMGMDRFIGPRHFYDLGKLLLAFCLVTGDFFYSQFLVIWFGNLPDETGYVILRVNHAPWVTLAWSVLIACFVMPFFILLSRKLKHRPRFMLLLSAAIMIGMWFERFLLIAPSLTKGESLDLGLPEALISAGFFGAVALTVMLFLKWVPLLPVSDPLFQKSLDAR